MQLRANTESVVLQAIRDDLVLVNLENGIYYSLIGSAAFIFSVLDSGCPQEELIGLLSSSYSEDLLSFKTDIDSFVQQLLGDSLLVTGVGSSNLNAQDFFSQPFQSPILNKYEDLQELLLLDPVRALPALDGATSDSD